MPASSGSSYVHLITEFYEKPSKRPLRLFALETKKLILLLFSAAPFLWAQAGELEDALMGAPR